MEKLAACNTNLSRSKYLVLMICLIIYSCVSNDKKKLENNSIAVKEVIVTRNDQVEEERERLNLKSVKSDGISVVLGKEIKFYNVNQIESDSIPFYGEILDILEVSQDKYPKNNSDDCLQFPYVHVSNARINGWLSGKYVYRIFDEPEMRIEISNEPYLVYKSRNFGVETFDSSGLVTYCDEYYPILLKSMNGEDYRIVNLVGGNAIYDNFQYLVLDIYDEISDVSSDSIFTVLKIKTEGMEGGKFYDLKLRKTEKDFVKGEIMNVSDWTF